MLKQHISDFPLHPKQGCNFRSDVKITIFVLKFGFTLSRKLTRGYT